MPGGSAANVCRCLAGLEGTTGRRVRFVGMVGADPSGVEYREKLAAAGVDPLLPVATSGAATAACMCLVTPGGQRTMRTHLGAATELAAPPAGWDAGGVALVHFEGYALYRPAALQAAMRGARAAGARVSLDLASFEVVERCWEGLSAVLEARLADLIFCNEDEAAAVCARAGGAAGGAVEGAQAFLLRHASVVVVSRGKAGCVAAAADGRRASCGAPGVEVVDTVGAGDLFTAGVLHAWAAGASLQACAECGCAAGAAAVQAAGAELSPAAMAALRRRVAAILVGT